MKFLSIITLLFISIISSAQTVQILNANTKEHFRGLSVVNDKVIWISGTKGTVGISTNGGETWHFNQVKGLEKRDLRDIEAFDENTAVAIAVDSPGLIIRTTDGGKSWETVYEDFNKGVFFDAMDFYNDKHGVLIGDAVDGHTYLATTKNGGRSWKYLPANKRPKLSAGEAFFAASGTNIRYLSKRKYAYVSGGKQAHLFIKKKKYSLPILHGKETQGPNSFGVNNKTIVVVGGDFSDAKSSSGNIVIYHKDPMDWQAATTPPNGYKSCIENISGLKWITCGLTGVDYSEDNCYTFKNISGHSFHVVRKAKNGNAVFFTGANGAFGKLINN